MEVMSFFTFSQQNTLENRMSNLNFRQTPRWPRVDRPSPSLICVLQKQRRGFDGHPFDGYRGGDEKNDKDF